MKALRPSGLDGGEVDFQPDARWCGFANQGAQYGRGAIDPDDMHTAGIFVHRIVKIPPPPDGWWPQPPGSIGR